jgi:hypothetical protein
MTQLPIQTGTNSRKEEFIPSKMTKIILEGMKIQMMKSQRQNKDEKFTQLLHQHAGLIMKLEPKPDGPKERLLMDTLLLGMIQSQVSILHLDLAMCAPARYIMPEIS